MSIPHLTRNISLSDYDNPRDSATAPIN